jgi:hypothetical protein
VIQFILRKATFTLWFVLAVVFDWIEVKVFHTDTNIGLTLGILVGSFICFVVNQRKISN